MARNMPDCGLFDYGPKTQTETLIGAVHWDGRLFVCGDQSGRTSAPINPHAVQTIRAQSARTGVSSGSRSAFMTAL